MTRKEKFYQVVGSNRKYLNELGVVSIGVFGSVARGKDRAKSDYDILVEFKKRNCRRSNEGTLQMRRLVWGKTFLRTLKRTTKKH